MVITHIGTLHIIASCSPKSQQLRHTILYFNWRITIQNIQQVAQAPCVMVLILPTCMNSSYKAIRTALSRTAPGIIISICSSSPSVLALILSKWMNSLKILHRLLWQNSSKQRYIFSSFRHQGWASHCQCYELLVQHIKYSLLAH